MINAAVLTISDSVDSGARADRSGPAVRDRLEQLGWRVSVMEVVPDEAPEISARLATLADGGQGTGLGLAIAKGIMEAHGGAIAAESPLAAGPGTRIVLTFPREGVPA